MFCTNCGKEVSSGSAFCVNCGHKVSENEVKAQATTPALVPATASTMNPSISKPKSASKVYIIIIALVLILGVGVVTIMSMSGGDNTPNIIGDWVHDAEWSGARFPSMDNSSADVRITFASGGRFTTTHFEHDGDVVFGDRVIHIDVPWHICTVSSNADGSRRFMGMDGTRRRYQVFNFGAYTISGNMLELEYLDGTVQRFFFEYGGVYIGLNGLSYSRQ